MISKRFKILRKNHQAFDRNGMTRESSQAYKDYDNKIMEIRSTINNIR